MSVQASQDFWRAGTRAYFKRSGDNPWRDLGVIQSVTPNVTTENVELEDPDGGLKQVVDSGATSVDENYDLTLSNLSNRNLALQFLAGEPTSVSIAGAEAKVACAAYVGELCKVLDANDADVFDIQIVGVYAGAPTVVAGDITAIDVSAKTITTTTDLSGSITAGDSIIVAPDGLADRTNAKTYTVAISAANLITVVESMGAADETAVTVDLIHGGTIYDNGDDWAATTVEQQRGFFRMIEGGAFAADASVTVVYWQNAISGERVFDPQSVDSIEGQLQLVFSRDSFSGETVRNIPRVKITPSSMDIQVDDYSSHVLNFKVLKDETKTKTVGEMFHYKGAVPSKS